jgi:anaerobic magnesium-protoporphyrin IX monomethyl ester cyclase
MLSILVAHSYLLRQAGHTVRVFDAMLAEGVTEYQQLLAEVRPQLVLLYEDSFNYLSKMCLERMREASCQMIGMARQYEARVIVAGSDASDRPEPYLRAGSDAVLFGEGLQTLQTLTDRLGASPQLPVGALIAGQQDVAALLDGQLRLFKSARPAPSVRPMDPPAWDLIDIDRYRTVWQRAHGYFSLNMAASRGCSFRCNWCSKPIWGNQYLQRTPGDVAAEMIDLKRRFQPDHIWFADDIFGFRPAWVAEFARLTGEAGGSVPFTIQARADLMSVAMASALKDAGCTEVWIGAESGSQRILDAMNKGTTIGEILIARDRLRARGIRVGFFIQLGYLGERIEDILATRSLIEQAGPDEVGVSVSYPLPGTVFYNQVKQQLGSKTHWRESSDLEMMFHGTYVSDFYRTVRDLLHEMVSANKLSAMQGGEPHRQALQSLQARWDDLVAREQDYRRDPGLVAAGANS